MPPADPLPWLLAQVHTPSPAPGASLGEAVSAMREQKLDRASRAPVEVFRAECAAWASRMIQTREPFLERWANFWTNHLTVSRRRRAMAPLIGNYQREAIRAHSFARYEDMLVAAYRHPAMLGYLDQNTSTGPASRTGQRRSRGLNENLARECMELHTVTPAANYTQEDVTSLARVLTGWTTGRGEAAGEPDGFVFRSANHEPGTKRVLGRSFPEGEEGGLQALRFLARHPATFRSLAFKLSRHFIADDPPVGPVRRIEAALRDTGGDLGAAARAVIEAPEAWEPLRKVRDAQDYVIAAQRALGSGPEDASLTIASMIRLNQSLWGAPAPNGWADVAEEWAAPEQLMRRLDLARRHSGRLATARHANPAEVADVFLGPFARAETVAGVRGAGSMQEAFLLLLASPEAQRR
ncbi:DUF1800 family protein [Roseococcus sp. SYP-B2431]|uniref:DUF1800 domain-containing protein n=1 Tax=Roseococcus sp. SYP-B2431 TaxID=2496640 RepID=UPI001F0E3736|nr:DUF1800 domain-containing protein [Roseococcus sp. SYP-B2431]